MGWTNFFPILWNRSIWIHFGLAIIMPFLLYGCIGFLIARFMRSLPKIKVGAILFISLLVFGLIIALIFESRGNSQLFDGYTILNYPISAFYRNAPDYGWSSGTAMFVSMGMAYLGLTKGFLLQRRILRSREGKKR